MKKSLSDSQGNPEGMPPKPKKKRHFFRSLFLFLLSLFLIACAAGAVALAWFIIDLSKTLPTDEQILSYKANEASVVDDRKNRVVAELYMENRRPVKLGKVSKWLIMSVLAAEDSAFYSHIGIRPTAILRSILVGDHGQGASTITQQLARNLFLTQEKSMIRKAKEAILSLRIEKLYSKDKLLETYLNAIYFGHGAWGVDAASHSYFAKPASDLSLAEASSLAGLIAAPEKYSPIKNPGLSKTRQHYVLGRLKQLGWITQEQYDNALKQKLVFNHQTIKKEELVNLAPYFVSQILFKELLPTYGTDRVYKGGLKIITTLDLELQQAAEAAMKGLRSEGALIAMDPNTGNVLALVGGKNFNKSKFNRATQAFRQPGSSFKPIVYATALEAGYLPNDHVIDRQISLEIPTTNTVWEPENFTHKYVGEETFLTALAQSHNTPVVRLTYLLGVHPIVEMARRLGVTSPHLKPALSIGLGVASITPLEMATVYSVFANGGARVNPCFIREIRNSDNSIVMTSTPSQAQAVDPKIAQMIRSMLKEVIRSGTGTKARIPGYEEFGKTGTTNDCSDAWFAGGVPGLVCVVYAGNDDYKTLGKKATGGVIALPVWTRFMKKAVTLFKPEKTFPNVSSELVEVKICTKTGFLATPSCPQTSILLPKDRVPNTPCPTHGKTGSGADDPNAPRLLLLPQDEYQQQTRTAARSQDSGPKISVQKLPPAQNPKEDIPVELPRPAMEAPTNIDKRYQDLLKQYHLTPGQK